MAKGIIGEPFTFTVLYVDASGDPITPTSSTIEVFYFDSAGAKQSLAAAGTIMSAVGGDPGRYAYTFTIPGALTPADQIYGVMTGVDPAVAPGLVPSRTATPKSSTRTRPSSPITALWGLKSRCTSPAA